MNFENLNAVRFILSCVSPLPANQSEIMKFNDFFKEEADISTIKKQPMNIEEGDKSIENNNIIDKDIRYQNILA